MEPLTFIKLDRDHPRVYDKGLNDFVKRLLLTPAKSVETPRSQGGKTLFTAKPLAKPQSPSKNNAASIGRVTMELEAALVLHSAGKPCKVRKAVVCAVKGWSRPTLYRRIAALQFPKPFKDGRSSWWWIADVIDDVIDDP
jgi:predicted DNA-binding transcriptional regulator AlpA